MSAALAASPVPDPAPAAPLPGIVDGKFKILFERELGDHALGPARCYAARGLDFPGEPGFVAWVVPKVPGPKTTHLKLQRNLEDPRFALSACGPVGRGMREDYALVYPKPAGKADRRQFGKMPANHLIVHFLKPAIQTLRDLRSRRLVHGHIHPDNVFRLEGDQQRLALGPSGHLPDGMDSARSFQTLERAMADPAGRGPAAAADDVFSLGMTLYAIATGAVLDDGDEMMRRRLAFGTSSSLILPAAIPVGLHEIVEGMIADDPALRWTIDEVGEAVAGRRPPRALSVLGERALPPMEIGPMTVQSRDEMLWAISIAPDAGARLLRDGSIQGWLAHAARRTGIEEDAIAAPADGNDRDERTVATAIATMSPRLPGLVDGLRFHPHAFGGLLRAAFDDAGLMAKLVAFVGSPLIDEWMLAAETAAHTDASPLRLIRRHRATILAKPEFALYRLDPDAPCMAPAGKGSWLEDVGAVAGMIDESCADGRPDGHLLAFLAARAHLDDELFADPAKAASRFETACTYLDACAAIQHAAGGRAMPNLAKSLDACVATILAAFRDPQTRLDAEAEAKAFLEAGDLVSLADGLLDIARHAGDEHAFQRAKGAYDAYHGLLGKSAAFRLQTARELDAASRDYVLAFAGLIAAAVLFGTFYLLNGGAIFAASAGTLP